MKLTPAKSGRPGTRVDILAQHMRSELDSERIGQRGFEDDFLFDRIVDALRPAERSGGLEFERPVALLAHVRSLEEAEQVLGVERIERIVRLSRLGRPIIVRRGDGRSDGDCKRKPEGMKSARMASGQDPPP